MSDEKRGRTRKHRHIKKQRRVVDAIVKSRETNLGDVGAALVRAAREPTSAERKRARKRSS